MSRMRIATYVAIMALVAFTVSARANSKVALVIGNSAYKHASELANPKNDATAIAASLARLGFAVTKVDDGDFNSIRRALLDFNRDVNGSEMAIVFFAGHGMEVAGENWLLPVDAELKTDIDAEQEAVSLRSVMRSVSKASRLGLVILDACRNNPFLTTMKRTSRTHLVNRGLIAVEPEGSVLVAYASRDGTISADGYGRNSPFTSALLNHIEKPGLEISFLFRNVRDDVLIATNREQEPFVYGSLSKEPIYLRPAGMQLIETPSNLSPLTRLSADRQPKPLSRIEEGVLRPGDTFVECTDCPRMAILPAGSFMLGSPQSEISRQNDEGPQAKVTIPRPFAAGVFEVSVSQYEAFIRSSGHPVQAGCRIWDRRSNLWDHRTTYTFRNAGFEQTGSHPVVCVGWDDAKAFAAWMKAVTDKPYRLLTEAEWEYAARAATATPFSFGQTISTVQANYDGSSTYGPEGRKGVRSSKTMPVDSFQPNAWGIFNMHGNVWEWVEDCYSHEDYKYLPPIVRQAGGVWPGNCPADGHAFRGGSWLDDAEYLRSARRVENRPGGRYNYLGFRVARTISP